MEKQDKLYIIYKSINLVNNKIYIGVHGQIGLDFDGYLGSGKWFRRSVKYHGENNFKRETLYSVKDEELAYFIEEQLVTSIEVTSSEYYNMTPGGKIPPRQSVSSREKSK